MDFLGDPSNPAFSPAETSKPSEAGEGGGEVCSLSHAYQLVTVFLFKSKHVFLQILKKSELVSDSGFPSLKSVKYFVN